MDITGLGSAFEFGSKVLDKIFPNNSEAKLKLMELQQSGELAALAASTNLAQGQMEINKIEAASNNLFVSGWRPFIGWVCGSAYAYAYVLQPIMLFFASLAGNPIQLPELGMGELSPVLIGLLGLGYLRTTEKIKGVN